MAPPADIGNRLEQAGDAVGEAATESARAGWSDLQPLLEFELLDLSGIIINVDPRML